MTMILHTDVATHAARIKVLRSALHVHFWVFLSAGTPEEEEEVGEGVEVQEVQEVEEDDDV